MKIKKEAKVIKLFCKNEPALDLRKTEINILKSFQKELKELEALIPSKKPKNIKKIQVAIPKWKALRKLYQSLHTSQYQNNLDGHR